MTNNKFIDKLQSVLVLKGIALILLGLVILFWPAAALSLILFFLAMYFIVDGIIEIVSGFVGIGRHDRWGLLVFKGVLSLVVGILAISYPAAYALMFIYLAGLLFIFRGISEIVFYFDIDQNGSNNRTLGIVSGFLGILVGILIINKPIASGVALTWVLGIYALVTGIILIVLSVNLKSLKKYR